jgi:hypothetical protein
MANKWHKENFMDQKETQAMLEAMEQDQSKGKGSFWTPEDGENTIRILPPLKPNGEVLPYFHHKTHWIDGNPYECLDQTFMDKHGSLHEAESCPACKMSKKLYKVSEKDSEERELAYSISAKDRYIFRIVDRAKDEATQTTPEFYEVGPAIFKKFFNILKGGKYGNIIHPVEGRDFIIDKQGTGRRTNYDSSLPDADKSPVFKDKEKLKEVLTNAVAMKYTDLIEFPSKDDVETAVREFLDPDSTDHGKSSGGNTSSAKKSNRSDDDDDTPPPAKKSAKSAKDEDSADGDQIDDLLNEFI